MIPVISKSISPNSRGMQSRLEQSRFAAREGDTRKGQQIVASESRMTDHIDRWASQIGRSGDPHNQLAGDQRYREEYASDGSSSCSGLYRSGSPLGPFSTKASAPRSRLLCQLSISVANHQNRWLSAGQSRASRWFSWLARLTKRVAAVGNEPQGLVLHHVENGWATRLALKYRGSPVTS